MRSNLTRLKLLSAGVLAAAGAVPALAAPSTMGDDAPIYQGTVAQPVGRSYSINANVRTLYDSNILRRGDGFETAPGESQDDIRISPSVNAEINLPFGRQQVYANGTLGRDYYMQNTRLNRNRVQVGAGAMLAAGSSCRANLDASYFSRQVLFSELGILVPNARETVNYGISANCSSAVGFGFGGGYRKTQSRNDNPTQAEFDLDNTAYTAQLSYSAGNIGTFSASGSKSKVTYINRPVLTIDGLSAEDKVDIISGRIGFSREIGSRLALTLGLSYFKTRPEPDLVLQLFEVTDPPGLALLPVERPGFSGLGYDASVTFRPSERISVIFAANRSANASINVGAVSQVRTSFLLDLDYKLGSGLRVGTGGSYNLSDYQNPTLNPSDAGNRRQQDQISRVYANVGYDASRLLSLALEVAYQDRKSTPVEFSFSSFSASLNLNLKFGRTS